MSQKQTITTYNGSQVEVRQLDRLEDGARLKATHPDGRRWIVEVDLDGDVSVEMTYLDGSPADLATPEWLEEELSLLARPA